MDTGPVKYSVIVAVFNSEKCLERLFHTLREALQTLPGESEIIFIDDCSTDGSAGILQRFASSDMHVRVFRFASNKGHALALKHGFDEARGEIIVSIDDDLQQDPADIPALIAKLNEGFDVVCGWRMPRKDPLQRIVISKIGNYIMRKTTAIRLHDIGCTLRAYRKDIVKDLSLQDRGDISFIPYILSRRTRKITEVTINHRESSEGKSRYNCLAIIFMVLYSYIRLRRRSGHGLDR